MAFRTLFRSFQASLGAVLGRFLGVLWRLWRECLPGKFDFFWALVLFKRFKPHRWHFDLFFAPSRRLLQPFWDVFWMSFGDFEGSASLGNLIFLGPWSCSSDVGLTDGISNSFWLPVKLHLGASNRHGLPVFGLSRSASAAGLGPSANMPTCNLSRKGVYTTLAHCRRSFQEVLRDVARNSFGNFRATYSSLRALS